MNKKNYLESHEPAVSNLWIMAMIVIERLNLNYLDIIRVNQLFFRIFLVY